MKADAIDHALTRFRSRPVRVPAKRFQHSGFAEVLSTAVRRLGDAIAEYEQPIPGHKLDTVLKRGQLGQHTGRRREAFEPPETGSVTHQHRRIMPGIGVRHKPGCWIVDSVEDRCEAIRFARLG